MKKRESMKKRILIASLLAILILAVPLTAAVGRSSLGISSSCIKSIKDIETHQDVETEESPQNDGILPAFVIVWCKWEQQDKGAGERTIHFLVLGLGHHVLEWKTWDDHDGDGRWDLWGPDPPWHEEWTSLFFPIRHFTSWVGWSGCTPDPGKKPKVKVKYWLDGRCNEETFEPEDW